MKYFINISFLLSSLVFLIGCSKDKSGVQNSSGRNTNQLLKIDSVFALADSLTFQSEFENSNKILYPRLEELSLKKDYIHYIDALNRTAANYRKLGNYDSAFAFCEKGLETSRTYKDSLNLSIAQTHYLLGLMYRDYGMEEDALNHLEQSKKPWILPMMGMRSGSNKAPMHCHLKLR